MSLETVAPSAVNSSSASSLGEDDAIVGVNRLAINRLPGLFAPGSSSTSLNETAAENSSSCSPSPPLVQPTVGATVSGSDHSSAGKRPRSPQPSVPPRKQASSSGRRKNESDLQAEAILKIVEIGRQKLDLLREMYQHVVSTRPNIQHAVSTRPNIPSIEVCMTRVYNLVGTADERALAAGDSLLEDKNRQLFLTLTDELAVMWIDRQLQMQNILYRQHFPGFLRCISPLSCVL